MFKAGTVASLTSAQSLVQDTQKDENKEGTTDHKKKQHNTKAQRSSPRGQATSRNQNFALFVLILLIFLILYHLNRKHTNFQLN
jgi:hypothetical protein